jgi:hypothetical protein
MAIQAYKRPVQLYRDIQALAPREPISPAAANEAEAFEPQTISDATFCIGLALSALGVVIVWGAILMGSM